MTIHIPDVGGAVVLLWKQDPRGLVELAGWLESNAFACGASATYGERRDEALASVQTVRLEYTPWSWRQAPAERRIVETWRIIRPHAAQGLKIERTVDGVLMHGRLVELGKDPDRIGLHPLAVPGGLLADFEFVQRVRGFFTFDDLVHFTVTLTLQSHMGLRGDFLEIGCYHGRSTCVLAKCLRPGERLVVCDTFDLGEGEKYRDPPTVLGVSAVIRSFVPALGLDQLELRRCRSEDLDLPSTARFRFVHVDGAHEKAVALHDIRLAAAHLCDGGVIAVDDYMHYEYQGVTAAVDEFLATSPDFAVLLDLNRREEEGRKIYLGQRAAGQAGAGGRNTDGRRDPGS